MNITLDQLTALTELYLRDNQLSTLPAEIGQLTDLKKLKLINNKLTALPAASEQWLADLRAAGCYIDR